MFKDIITKPCIKRGGEEERNGNLLEELNLFKNTVCMYEKPLLPLMCNKSKYNKTVFTNGEFYIIYIFTQLTHKTKKIK
jgi:hypothetical protein